MSIAKTALFTQSHLGLSVLALLAPIGGVAFAMSRWPHIQGDRPAISAAILVCIASVFLGLIMSAAAAYSAKRFGHQKSRQISIAGVVLSVLILAYGLVSLSDLGRKVERAREVYREPGI